MAEKNRKLAPATLLILLSIAAFTTAAVIIQNITVWYIKAARPPIFKAAGLDCENCAIRVSYEIAPSGENRTVIVITGFRGDIVNYSSVFRVCHAGSSTLCYGGECSEWNSKKFNVKLVYKGVVQDWQWNNSIKWIEVWIANSSSPQKIFITNGNPGGETDEVLLEPGDCIDVAASLLIDANLPDSQLCVNLTKIEIDVIATEAP